MFKFITSCLHPSTWHDTKGNPQIVFWGRSNVGKSSLLNALVGQKIAFVSKTPGRTQLINFFADNNNKYIVDLPGYGYAQMSKTQQNEMMQSIKQYLAKDPNPKHIFILIDSRTGVTAIDRNILSFIQSLSFNFSLIYTKLDKLNQKEKSTLIKNHNKLIEFNIIDENTEAFLVSAQKKTNLDELINFINLILYPNKTH
ncbi:ribosome biogenesis GTP-binding protein YsxC (EngB) [Mycoplasmopsis californica]|uniref:Probable GTP-binding protein EngB n=1 Tax=Mycoplasmopsis californica TaxID=2113 RepID=A0A059XLQ6_9BACT|nr:ribosome biogenesis GTP-binding protein YihA/YsxC [Mycoplasmopsis californica]AIA29464.1 ribosome biogenesis GTP-binding protein YsxC (EngB) [Mycoplasmopsis californica]